MDRISDIEKYSECYGLNWVGKKAAIAETYKPSCKILTPCPEESKHWENTGNIYIEGDNLEALKLLQDSSKNRIKMIYRSAI